MNRKARRAQRKTRTKLAASPKDWTEAAVNDMIARGSDVDTVLVTYAIGTICSHHGTDSFEMDDRDSTLTVTDARSGRRVSYSYEEWFLGCVEHLRLVRQELYG